MHEDFRPDERQEQHQHPHSHRLPTWCSLPAWLTEVRTLLRRGHWRWDIQGFCHTIRNVLLKFVSAPSKRWKMPKSIFIPMGYSIQLSGTEPQTAEEELEETEDAEEEGTNQLLLVFTTNK